MRLCTCVSCVRACVRACVRMCARVCIRICMLGHTTKWIPTSLPIVAQFKRTAFYLLEALDVGLVEWKWHVCIAWYHSCEITIFVISDEVRMNTGVIRLGGVNVGNRRLIEAKMKGCHG